jgi:hypothetical protein
MPSPCLEFQARLIAHWGDGSELEPDVARHLESCATCSALAQRVERQVRALRDLPRLAAPHELTGSVVAALHGGYRQERTIAHLRDLTRWTAPAEMDERILSTDRERMSADVPRAPRVLDRLVDDDLHDPSKALTRRFAGKLERLRAPGALRVRVERTAESPSDTRRRRLRVVVAASLVLVFAFMVSGGIYWLEKPRYSFEVVHESSLDALDPIGRALLNGLTGGLTDAQSSGGTRR